MEVMITKGNKGKKDFSDVRLWGYMYKVVKFETF